MPTDVPAAAAVLTGVLADLVAEGDALDAVVAGLDAGQWATPTPAQGWTVAHQIAHLAWTDDVATLAAADPAAFADVQSRAAAAFGSGEPLVDRLAAERAGDPELLTTWRVGRGRLATALTAVPRGTKLPWFGPPMSPTSMATARIMETWAHGQDVADALHVPHPPSDRLRHVAHIGVRTRDFAYLVNDRTPPTEPFRVELVGPSGELWAWGPSDAAQHVTGPALDFCLLVTQRRHRADLSLVAAGAQADEWLGLAQAFAGPPGGGRVAGQFA